MHAPRSSARWTDGAALALCALVAGCAPQAAVDAAVDAASEASSGSDAAMPTADAPDAGADATDARDAAVDAADAADAADAIDAATTALPCLGDSRPLVLSHNLPYATVSVGVGASAPSGLFLLDVATTASAIDLSAFGSMRPVATGCNPALLGQSCGFADLDFFGSWGAVTLITEDLSGLGGGVTEAGILGTDFTSAVVLTLDYAAAVARRTSHAGVCSDATLSAAGFAPLPTTGFYANDLSLLRPLSDVETGATPGISVANVPTVTVRLAGVAAVAQLDTGFDDARVASSVNINTALFDAVQAAHPGALVRDAAHDLTLSTCVVGVSEPVEAYDLAPGSALDLVAMDGSAARSFGTAAVFVKRTPASARSCGGIGTWTAPAGQIASSLIASLGTLVFDPYSSRVWVRTH